MTNDSGDFVGLLLVERQHHRGVDAGRGEQLEALLGIGEQLRRRLRPNDHRRVAIEREDHRAGLELGSDRAHLIDDCLVAEVHAVVGADGDDGAFARPRRRVELGDHLHAARRYRAVLSTTAGLAVPRPNGS